MISLYVRIIFNLTAKLALILCIALDKKFEDLFLIRGNIINLSPCWSRDFLMISGLSRQSRMGSGKWRSPVTGMETRCIEICLSPLGVRLI